MTELFLPSLIGKSKFSHENHTMTPERFFHMAEAYKVFHCPPTTSYLSSLASFDTRNVWQYSAGIKQQ